MRIGLTRLHIFYLVAKHGSMKKAADLLYVSPPAVTMQIKKMEEQLGAPVFERIHGVLRLTDYGRGLYARVEPIFDQLDAVERYIEGMAQDEERVLMLGTHHLPGNYFIPDLIEHVRAQYPELDVRMSLGTQDGLLEKVLRQQLDVTLIIGEPPQGVPCRAMHLFDVELVLVTADPDLFRNAACISMHELEGVPLILQQQGTGARSTVLDWFGRSGVTPNVLLENLSSDVIKQFLPKMKAASFIGRFIVQEDLDRRLLREIRVEQGLPAIRFQLVYRDAECLNPKLRKFLDGVRGFTPSFETMP